MEEEEKNPTEEQQETPPAEEQKETPPAEEEKEPTENTEQDAPAPDPVPAVDVLIDAMKRTTKSAWTRCAKSTRGECRSATR